VRDNGVGIDQENLDNIFERYSHFEADEETIPSSGLGLYIAKQLIHRQGGTLSVNSQKGVGSDFTVRVPITRGGLVEQEHYDVKGKIALIVGTREREKQFIKDQLGHREMVCLHADTAIEALAQLAEHQIDIILVDDSVADIDVESFIAEARKRQAKMLIAVLSEEEHVGEKYSVIKKPIRKEALTAIARKMATPNLAGVDYGLIDRLNSRRDKDGI
jgi:CheY-like chemotaxis protein